MILKSVGLNGFLLVAVAAVTAVGCGSKSSDSSKSESTNTVRRLDILVEQVNSRTEYTFEYEYEKNFCNTGIHKIKGSSRESTRQSYCSALRDHARNKNCAADLRQEAFQENCPNQRWEPQVASAPTGPATPTGPAIPPTSAGPDAQPVPSNGIPAPSFPSQPNGPIVPPTQVEQPAKPAGECKAIEQLAAAGIGLTNEVKYRFKDAMQSYCEIVQPIVRELIKRKHYISKVGTGNFQYDYQEKALDLSHSGTEVGDLEALDKAVAFSKETGVELQLSIAYPKMAWDENEKVLTLLKSKIKAASKGLREIIIYNVYTEYDIGRKALWFRSGDNRENVEAGLADAQKSIGALAPWQGFKIEARATSFSLNSVSNDDILKTLEMLKPIAPKLKALLKSFEYDTIKIEGPVQFNCDTQLNRGGAVVKGKLELQVPYDLKDCNAQAILTRLTKQLALEAQLGIQMTESVRSSHGNAYVHVDPSAKNVDFVALITPHLQSSKKVKIIRFSDEREPTLSTSGVLMIPADGDKQELYTSVTNLLR